MFSHGLSGTKLRISCNRKPFAAWDDELCGQVSQPTQLRQDFTVRLDSATLHWL